MKNRIRVGVLLFKNDTILLVRHVNPKNSYEFFVPPGGGIQNDETIFEAAIRETFEETGLIINAEKIVYFRQFIFEEFEQNNIDIYVIGNIISGNLTINNMYGKGDDENFIQNVGFFSKDQIKNMNVFPKILKNKVWEDKKKGFPDIKFIGIERDKE